MNEISKQLSELELFLSQYKNRNTFLAYEKAIRTFYTFLGTYYPAMESLDNVTLEVMLDFQSKMIVTQKAKSVNLISSAVRKFFNFLQERGHIERNQIRLLKPMPVSRREQKVACLTLSETYQLIQYVNGVGDTSYDINNKIMILILLNTGLRAHEMASLRLRDLVEQDGHYTLTILGKGGRYRHITLSEEITTRIKELITEFIMSSGYKLGPNDYIVQNASKKDTEKSTRPLNRSNIVARVTTLSANAGITKHITTHSLRRSLATILYGKGIAIENIQRLLGHDDIKTTLTYIDHEIDKAVSLKCAVNII